MQLLPFQARFLKALNRPSTCVACLSLPRGNGKSTLAAYIAYQFLHGGSGKHCHIIAASMSQARRTVFKQLLEMLGDDDRFRIANSPNDAHILHKETGTYLSVLAADHKTAQGLVGVPLVIADEPGAWQTNGGALCYEALATALGKPGSDMRLLLLGTLAPSEEGSWWWHLCLGEKPFDGTIRHIVQGIGDWHETSTIKAANPLMWKFANSRKVLLAERDEAQRDTRLIARFKSYRLNLPTRDASEMLLTVDDWKAVKSRQVGAANGPPIVGVDLGGGLSWSAAVAVWPSGRVEALAVCGGSTSIEDQEKRDKVPRGLYRRLVAEGSLEVIEGVRVPPVSSVVERIGKKWGRPREIIADRFRELEMRDAAPDWVFNPRVSRWSESSFDIRATRKMAMDGNMAVDDASAHLLEAAMAHATVRVDDAGNSRLEKRARPKESRDDAAQALVLACGALERSNMVGQRPRIRIFEHV